ncbi:zinc-binding alcohol dehydrogenase family protein [Aspergillus ibericus CBS 121593]|uniref:Oxidoreductase n=1 Tax=Aspergillus ibericus CBS 121593 TaxID=1448316 RepID=A0A395GJD5_9EURO|nr:oxidoreductase [Aspergillus ibericus CBS 121593]RAK95158.1 oxidoreductase [Aspergillus ibericus CBS 121593]
MSPTNTAAWIQSEKAHPLTISPAPYPQAGNNELIIRNHAIGLNLVDYARQDLGTALFPWTNYPTILGSDVAGEVVEVGPGPHSSRFRPGDRVLGLTNELKSNRSAEGAFQTYVVLQAHMTSHIPADLSYADAAGIPLGISTAACGLFQKEYLALQHPRAPRAESTSQTVLIWSGSSSVGSNAIQLAVAAGYEVITTASPKNYDFVKSLGASLVFDYASETVVEDIIAAFTGKIGAGALAIGPDSPRLCAEIVARVEGRKFVALVSPATGPLQEGVDSKFVFGSDLVENEVGEAVFVNFLPEALRRGEFVSAPKTEVMGRGLEDVQGALEVLKRGVSARKLVVEL